MDNFGAFKTMGASAFIAFGLIVTAELLAFGLYLLYLRRKARKAKLSEPKLADIPPEQWPAWLYMAYTQGRNVSQFLHFPASRAYMLPRTPKALGPKPEPKPEGKTGTVTPKPEDRNGKSGKDVDLWPGIW